jgi:restriction endonuclease S subunit
LNYGTDLRQFVKLGEYGIDVDNTELQKAINAGLVSQDEADDWIESLSEQYEIS